MSDALNKQLELARRDLLELSTMNRLINTKRDQGRGSAIEIKDEWSSHVLELLVKQQEALRFDHGEEDDSDSPKKRRSRKTTKKKKEDPVDPKTDCLLHTEMTPEDLDDRLVKLVTDSNASFQEKGINVLYLAVGFVKWFEVDKPDMPRHAPLLLVPVELERDKAGTRYRLKWTGHELEANLSAAIRFKIDFNIDLPHLPDVEDLVAEAYFKDVADAISGQPNWELLEDDMVLWFFSFTKLLMYRDLDPETWPAVQSLEDRPLIRSLLDTGFPPVEPLCDDDAPIDQLFDPAQTAHVIDCDSSQSLVIEEACRGRNLVIQGPPGTGKSQTITNLIASAVTAGKTILFVAEKMAALEVVKRRLDNIGIGDMCLELHSNKSRKRAVLEELHRTLKLGTPQLPDELEETVIRLKERRDELNRHVDVMHQAQQPSQMTPYQILTELIDLRSSKTALPDFKIEEATTWSGDEYRDRLEAVTEVSRAMEQLGDPAMHPWRGSELDQILPLDLERLLTAVPKAEAAIQELIESATTLSQGLNADPASSLSNIAQQLNTVDALIAAPKLDESAAAGTTWVDHRKAVKELADGARTILNAKATLADKVSDAAWDVDVQKARQDYATYGKSFFRIFYSAYRSAKATLAGVVSGSVPSTYEGRQEILDLLYGHQKALKDAGENRSLGERAFGKFWLGSKTDWQQISDWEEWDQKTSASNADPRFRQLLQSVDDENSLRPLASVAKAKLTAFADTFCAICDSLKLNIDEAFGAQTQGTGTDDQAEPASTDAASDLHRLQPARHVRLEAIQERMREWTGNPEGLQHWQLYARNLKAIHDVADGAFANGIRSGSIPGPEVPAQFRFGFFESVLRKVLADHPELEAFDGNRFEQRIEDFQQLDRDRLKLARAEVAAAHWTGIGRKRSGNVAEAVSLLKHEMQKKRRHLPLRQLLNRAGSAVQAIKPVMMMSPLSVSQYLEPGAIEFDMLLIDEASQVRPVEALGAAARCRQMVVVGDDKQMPPTQFFGKVVGDVDIDDDDAPAMQAGDVESILGLCIARNMPQRMLRWHYRSKHESLIAVSNREFYDGRLYIIPSAFRSGELGVKFHFIEDGQFKSGKNVVEAKAVAAAIMLHAKERTDWTLGVAAFSVSQRDLIIDELETLRRQQPDTEAFFDTNAPDPFFVKNLENVQGDERDVIFVSVGYGPGEDGKVSLNFGPVSASGGERRLNVLMTRAKRRCEMFSSMRAEDIDVNRVSGQGPKVFREYLRFAQSGANVESATSSVAEDRLVQILQQQLLDQGYDVKAHVGIAGVFVDLAVVDPDDPDRYLLGIDIDGESYRSSRSARDRDRTRHAVLGSQGWNMHQIWTIEWFRRPVEQLNELVAAIEKVRKGLKEQASGLESREFELMRQTGGPDPLSLAVADAEPVPERTDAEQAEDDVSLSKAVFSSVLKAGAAAVTAREGGRLDAAIKSLGKK
ncbi:MAG: DUF4011 domain-containing protein [Fuerstiella sp.]